MKRLHKFKGMYVLLIAVAAMIGITIYGSCSVDEDYDNYSSGDELFTLADGEMNLRTENQGTFWFQGFYIDSAGIATYDYAEFIPGSDGYYANFTIGWSAGWTGNINAPYCHIYAYTCAIYCTATHATTRTIEYDEFPYHFRMANIQWTSDCEWRSNNKLYIMLKFTGDITRERLNNEPEQNYWGTKTFELELTYDELLSYCVDY